MRPAPHSSYFAIPEMVMSSEFLEVNYVMIKNKTASIFNLEC